jgi:DNA-binding CsgD family transcriptional regulator
MKINIEQLKQDFDKGLTYREMAFNQRISLHTVYYHLGQLGLIGVRDRGVKSSTTNRQQEMLDWFIQNTKEKGIPPSARELGRYFGIAYQSAKGAIYRLYEKGFLDKGEYEYKTTRPFIVKRYYKLSKDEDK